MLATLASSVLALGLEPNSCAMVDIVHTNLSPADAEQVMSLYLQVAEVSGEEPEPIAKQLLESRGGFWDTCACSTIASTQALSTPSNVSA